MGFSSGGFSLPDNSVTTTKIADANVTLAKAAADLLAAISGGSVIALGHVTSATLNIASLATTSYPIILVVWDIEGATQGGSVCYLTLNNDSGANYHYQILSTENTNVAAAYATNGTGFKLSRYTLPRMSGHAFITNTATYNKKVSGICESDADDTATGLATFTGSWMDTTNLINRITIAGGTFAATSKMFVYGISAP